MSHVSNFGDFVMSAEIFAQHFKIKIGKFWKINFSSKMYLGVRIGGSVEYTEKNIPFKKATAVAKGLFIRINLLLISCLIFMFI